MDKVLKKPSGFADNFVRKPGNYPKVTHYCPGCGHGRIHKLIAEAMEELEITDKTVFISPVGCSVFGYYYFDCGNMQAAHGRAPAVGTGAARSNPGSITISYQGDGDLAAIGTAEIVHAANRGEDMTVIFVNNTIYGMTGGQMAPTTLEGQKTTTSPTGRELDTMGQPIRMSEIIAQLETPVYVERVAVTDTKHIMKTKKAIKKALLSQKNGQGFSFVEIISACPIGWKMKPTDAIKRLNEEVIPFFPLNKFKDETDTRPAKKQHTNWPKEEDIIEVLGVNKESNLFPKDEKFIKEFTQQSIRIAGFGGQGVLLAGTTLGYLGMELGLQTTWLPSYGPEMRGGTANCHVVVDNKEIGSPVVDHPNVLIAMNGPSLDEFAPSVKEGGLIIINSSIIAEKYEREGVTTIYVPMNDIATDNGVRQAANMAAIAAYLAYSNKMGVDALKKCIEVNFKKKNLIQKNLEVIDAAAKYIQENYGK
jgi:2-oxoisovalerate ferredoxin oxidoreductase beta subunit